VGKGLTRNSIRREEGGPIMIRKERRELKIFN
jgi:hypothetical protein